MNISATDRLRLTDSKPVGTQNLENTWKLLIVDDEVSVHSVTEMALMDFTFANREIEFLNAHSAEQAISILNEHDDIAIILLDVVMETDDAGFRVASHLRETLNNKATRIILRTGQPGYAPEREVVENYDINDYKEKTELTSTKLYSAIFTALRCYQDILALNANRKGLGMVLEATASMFRTRNISNFAQGVLEQLAAIIYADPNAVYCQVDGVAAAAATSNIEVIAATGDFAGKVGEDVSHLDNTDFIEAINAAHRQKQSVTWSEDIRATYFETESGHKNIVCVRGTRSMTTEFVALIDLYLRNVSIAFQNLHLQNDLIQEVAERREAERSAAILARLPGELPEPVMRISDDGIVRYANEFSNPILNHLGTSVGSPFPDEWQNHITAVLHTGRRHDIELDVDDRIYELSLSPVPEAGYVNLFGRDVTQLRDVLKKLEHVAFHDHLTGIANRLYFKDQLEKALQLAKRRGELVGIMLLDLNRFKQINDAWGHETGDSVLKEVAVRLQNAMRTSDVVARLGGDEFGIVLTSIDSTESMAVLANRVLEEFSRPCVVDGKILPVGCSIGLSVYPADADNASELQQSADMAMYQSKSTGKDGYQFFDNSLQRRARQRLEMEIELREALEADRFELFYQPLVSIVDGRTIGAEALLRFRRADLNLVPPGDFIPIAEQTGLIEPIGDWVLQQVCRDINHWMAKGGKVPPISCNLSGVQLRSPQLPSRIESILREAGVPPNLLEVEITESVLVDASETSMKMLLDLRQIGISLAIDDFGTGYSSLSYLRYLPVSKLKIDRSFVSDMRESADAMTIVEAIISLGNSLRMRVLAEGIESPEQQELLRSKGCVEGQGFLFSKPIPAAAFDQFLIHS